MPETIFISNSQWCRAWDSFVNFDIDVYGGPGTAPAGCHRHECRQPDVGLLLTALAVQFVFDGIKVRG